MAMGILGSTVGVAGGTEDLARKESHPMDDGMTDDDYKLEEVVEEENP